MDEARLRARYRRIMGFFARLTISFIFWEILLPRIGLRAVTRRTRSRRIRNAAQQFRALAVQLGGVMIKVGQFLSSRLDVLPPEATDELANLQDEVPAEDFETIRQLAEQQLGAPLSQLFADFDPVPLAAASLGQVHRACLRADTPQAAEFQKVVVKIQRPYIESLIEVDLRALQRFGGWLQRYEPIRRRADVPALVEEFSATIRQEVDYLTEGRNAETFAANFRQRKRVHVPRVVWELTTQKVLTLEDVYAIKITDYEAIRQAGIEPSEVAKELLDTYLQQIFEDGFFHADPHPGNLFVTPIASTGAEALTWRLTFVDFGMVGTVPDSLRHSLRELLIAVGTRDAARVVQAFQAMNVILPGADLKLIEEAEAQLFERYWGMNMRQLTQISHAEMMRFALQFRQLLYEMPFQIPHNLLLLGRTVAILSGMCTGLDPNFNVWFQLQPYAEKLLADEVASNWRNWLTEAGEWLRLLLALPSRADRFLQLAESGKLTVQTPLLEERFARVERGLQRLYYAWVGGVFFLGGILLWVNGVEVGGMLCLALGAWFLLWSLLRR
ncbi:MAG: ABC transporter [Anaerolineae bacterium]|jgi:predicted unusual protein kinase regulating ubiquinone biosynthesis (AarF/ABC1/UbiB family)|nr:MAG: ABC transporter [Anaerolineae bacterium]